MEGELIDSARSTFYLEQLEQLFRNEAYMIHLQKIRFKMLGIRFRDSVSADSAI